MRDVHVDVLMVGTGEYTTGYVHGAAAKSDKGAGVVGLTLFDLRRRGRVGRLAMAGSNGNKFPGIRRHLERAIGSRYADMNLAFDSFPEEMVEKDPKAYLDAMETMAPGDAATVFTPDDTHFQIAMDAVKKGLHVLIAKPLVKTLEEHLELQRAAAGGSRAAGRHASGA